jgi:hypothetical protein
MKKRLLFTFMVFTCLQSAARQPGKIEGMVRDEEGRPLDAARVSVDPLDGRPQLSAVREVETKKDGHFTMDNLQWGSYKVFAMKESAGYPDTSFAFYSNQIFSTVTLAATAPSVDLLLKVGPPAGIIRGRVANAVTTEPLNAGFLLRRATDLDNWISLSERPEYRVLLPPNTDIVIEVSAPGYKTFYYGGPSDPLARPPIRLEPRQEMKLDIKLQPSIPEAKH